MMNHARVRAADLRFHLFERSVHPELFEVLRQVDLRGSNFRATLVISGQSHVAAVRAGGETLTEIVAPGGAALPRIGVRSALRLRRGTREDIRRDEGAIRYRAILRVEAFPPADYERVIGRLLAANPLERIKAFFDDPTDPPGDPLGPARPQQADFMPFALIDFRHEGRALEVVSVHACPRELTIVRADTRFQVR